MIVVAIGHIGVFFYTEVAYSISDLLLTVYLPWYLLSILGFVPVFLVKKNENVHYGMAYLVSSIVKMTVAMFYLLPFLLEPSEKTTIFGLSFVLVFFFVLVFEVLYFIGLTKQ
jgi:hypothetical protein